MTTALPPEQFLATASREALERFVAERGLVVPERRSIKGLRTAIARALGLSLAAPPAPPPDEAFASFAAIDFETADQGRDSACAVAVVRVEHGAIVARKAVLVRPPRRQFIFSYIHGITWDMVAQSPGFAEAWPQVEPLLLGVDRVWAHNASFDKGVVTACCAAFGVQAPSLTWACSMKLARQRWGFDRPNLANVASTLGIPLRHHDAASDAEACARVVLAARALLTP